MRLKSFRVQHYKSIDDVTLDIAPDVTVIVGPNGVGKSNFVDAMRFFRETAILGITNALSKREGIAKLLPLGLGNKSRMHLDSVFEKTNPTRFLNGTVSISIEKWNASPISTSNLLLPSKLTVQSSSRNELSKDADVSQSVHAWQSYTLYPNVLRDANRFRKRQDKHLLENGENWMSVLHAMQSTVEGQVALEQVYAALRIVMPAFDRIEIVEAGNFLIPRFLLNANNADTALDLEPEQLSDGTLRLFGILIAAYQIPRPSLLIIEEPEQTIYPGALSLLADVFKEISGTTQVIITTHSPHLVQQFAPDQIRVATMQDGVTQIRKIHPHQKEAVEEGLLSLEEFMTKGGLQPDDSASASEA